MGGGGGGWLEEFGNNANSVQLLLQLPTGTELGNIYIKSDDLRSAKKNTFFVCISILYPT